MLKGPQAKPLQILSKLMLVPVHSSSSSSKSRWRAKTFLLNSAGSLSHNSAASPLRGLALEERYQSPFTVSVRHSKSGRGLDILVRLPQQTLQTQQHAHYVQHGTPLLLEDVQAYAPAEVDVRMVDGGFEDDGRGRIRVVGREGEGELEDEVGVRSGVGAGESAGPG